jgi:hypothetical protein
MGGISWRPGRSPTAATATRGRWVLSRCAPHVYERATRGPMARRGVGDAGATHGGHVREGSAAANTTTAWGAARGRAHRHFLLSFFFFLCLFLLPGTGQLTFYIKNIRIV